MSSRISESIETFTPYNCLISSFFSEKSKKVTGHTSANICVQPPSDVCECELGKVSVKTEGDE